MGVPTPPPPPTHSDLRGRKGAASTGHECATVS